MEWIASWQGLHIRRLGVGGDLFFALSEVSDIFLCLLPIKKSVSFSMVVTLGNLANVVLFERLTISY